MMRPTKIYEHPEFTTEEADLSLFSTICLVLTMVLMGALFVMAFSSFVLWNDGTHCKFIHTISPRSYVDIYTSCFNGLSTRVCILGDTKGVPTKPMIRFRVILSSVSVDLARILGSRENLWSSESRSVLLLPLGLLSSRSSLSRYDLSLVRSLSYSL